MEEGGGGKGRGVRSANQPSKQTHDCGAGPPVPPRRYRVGLPGRSGPQAHARAFAWLNDDVIRCVRLLRTPTACVRACVHGGLLACVRVRARARASVRGCVCVFVLACLCGCAHERVWFWVPACVHMCAYVRARVRCRCSQQGWLGPLHRPLAAARDWMHLPIVCICA